LNWGKNMKHGNTDMNTYTNKYTNSTKSYMLMSYWCQTLLCVRHRNTTNLKSVCDSYLHNLFGRNLTMTLFLGVNRRGKVTYRNIRKDMPIQFDSTNNIITCGRDNPILYTYKVRLFTLLNKIM
jgi:hypothetical protein